MTVWNLLDLDQSFAEAAIDPLLWRKALNLVTSSTESFGAILIPFGNKLPNIPHTESMSSSLDTYLRDEWYLRDERNVGLSLMKKRGVVDDLDTMSFERIRRHPYYQEFLAPHNLRWFAGVRIACGDDLWCLSIQRTIEQGPFSSEEKHLLAQLSKRLAPSAALAKAIGAATAAGALEAFEMSGTAVALINRQGLIYKINASAETLLVNELEIVRGRVASPNSRAAAALDRCLHNLIWNSKVGTIPIVFPRIRQGPVLAYPSKLTSITSNSLADCQAVVVFIDTDSTVRPPAAVLRSVYGLSEAEAKLAAAISDGEPISQIADMFGVTKETARTQLKGIFFKLGVSRQAELIALLSRFPHSNYYK